MDETPKGKQFDFLRPEGTIPYTVDKMYGVPEIGIYFNGWYKASVRLWPKSSKTRSNFLNLQRTLLRSLTFSTPLSDLLLIQCSSYNVYSKKF